MTPDPVWPVVVLALIQLGDAALCRRPVAFVARCLTDVGFPRRWWPVLTPLKIAAALGLLAGVVVPWLGLVVCLCLVAYFVVAITMHLRARDLGRNLFLNASGMLIVCCAVTVVSFGP
ncbi:MAG TPA: DoxX family protein [Actinomycetospora sp.]|nr:DoxX family protein [Actinomycetospora sp.]